MALDGTVISALAHDIARALSGGRISKIAMPEKAELNARIRRIVEMGTSVLLVEHDMSLVMNIADKIYVLNSGKNLAQGTPEEIADNEDVIEAYLGRGDYR